MNSCFDVFLWADRKSTCLRASTWCWRGCFEWSSCRNVKLKGWKCEPEEDDGGKRRRTHGVDLWVLVWMQVEIMEEKEEAVMSHMAAETLKWKDWCHVGVLFYSPDGRNKKLHRDGKKTVQICFHPTFNIHCLLQLPSYSLILEVHIQLFSSHLSPSLQNLDQQPHKVIFQVRAQTGNNVTRWFTDVMMGWIQTALNVCGSRSNRSSSSSLVALMNQIKSKIKRL